MLMRNVQVAAVAVASPIPHWLFVAGGAFAGGAMAVLGQASWTPEFESIAAGDFRGALVKALPVLLSGAAGGVAALVTLAKTWATLPAKS
jgi:hypothetical protein